MANVELPGVDLQRLTSWMDDAEPGLRNGELSGEVVSGGKSNLTYRITDGTNTWALRRPPLAHVLPTAHDMVREFRVINALAPTDVAVPTAVALCQDVDVLGAPFYLMGFVDGVVLDKPDLLAELSNDAAAEACRLLVDALADLHEVDPATVGLEDFGRPDGFLERQVRRWHKQWQASETRPLDVLTGVVDRLGATLPDQSPSGIVHGDYRLTNVMFDQDVKRIAAVVDWEMATLGDPLMDLGALISYWVEAGDEASFLERRRQPTHLPGMLTRAEVIAYYGEKTGWSVDDFDFYEVFGLFRLAVIIQQIYKRFYLKQTTNPRFAGYGQAANELGRRCQALIARSRL